MFDNARRDLAKAFAGIGFNPANKAQFSVDQPDALHTDPREIANALWDLTNRAPAGCLIYFTSHGSPDGIVVDEGQLAPNRFATMVGNACGSKPSVIVMSACFSGIFVPPLAAPNRMILTAARPDRTSFGCGGKRSLHLLRHLLPGIAAAVGRFRRPGRNHQKLRRPPREPRAGGLPLRTATLCRPASGGGIALEIDGGTQAQYPPACPLPETAVARHRPDRKSAAYPFCLPLFKGGFELAFDKPVTIIVGETAPGKSTLLEGIAALAGYDEAGGGKGYNPVDHSQAQDVSGSALAGALKASWLPRITQGWFFRAESFFSVARYLDLAAKEAGPGRPRFLSHSHGEGFLRFFDERCDRQGFYIFDEPESALSPARQIEFLKILARIRHAESARSSWRPIRRS